MHLCDMRLVDGDIVSVANAGRTSVIGNRVRVAVSLAGRMKGLLGCDVLHPDEGLLIYPCHAVHTWFMRFPIDVAFLSDDGSVLALRHALPPWRTAGCIHATSVLELPAGTLRATDTEAGDLLVFEMRNPGVDGA